VSHLVNGILSRIWNRFAGTWQWYALWLMHSKFIVGVSGVITNARGEVLLLRHLYRRHDQWGLPSGYANSGEALQVALAREISEETGYVVDIGPLVNVTSGFRLRIEMTYLGKVAGGTLRLDKRELLEAKFFPRHNLPTAMLDSHRQLVATAFSRREGDT
jgi:8-oxo-dGTP diphosphatase